MEVSMKKMLYSTLLLVGLVASFQMEARVKSGDAALSNADTDTLIGRIESMQEKIKNNNYESGLVYHLRDLANDAEAALYPETAKQEALISLAKTKKALESKEFPKNKRKVVSDKLARMEERA